jgi:hypothetical protein
MYRFIIILIILAFMAASPCSQAWAGSGITTGSVVDLTVFFDDASQLPADTTLPAASNYNWINNFTDASRYLYRTTGGKLRFGTIRMGAGKSMKGRRDIEIGAKGQAHVLRDPDQLKTSLGTDDTTFLYKEDMSQPIVTLHELGHYIFTLGDEYVSEIRGVVDGTEKVLEKKDEDLSWCSSKDGKTHDCVMYNNNKQDTFYLFCNDDHQAKNILPNDTTATGRYAITAQQRRHGKSCGAVMASFFGINSLPAPLTTNLPENPAFVLLKPEVRLSVLIQGTLSADDMKLAKKEAKEAVRRLRLTGSGGSDGGDSLGVSTFTASLSSLYGFETVATETDRNAALKKIDGITAQSGSADIEASLKEEIPQIVGTAKYAFSARTILLITDCPGSVSQDLIDSLRRSDITVDVVALKENGNTKMLKAMTAQTGGKYEAYGTSKAAVARKAGAVRLLGRDGAVVTEESGGTLGMVALGGYLVAAYTGNITPESPVNLSLPVDNLSDRITLEYSTASGTPVLSLRDPSGALLSLDVPPANVAIQQQDTEIIVTVDNPMPGTWTALLDGSAAGAFALELSGIGESMGESQISNEAVSFPAATRLTLVVAKDQVVTGCQVQACVTAPGGTQTTVQLYDDGDMALHGDEQANDGVYSGYFTPYTASGTYSVEFFVLNQTGQYSTAATNADLLPGDPAPGPTGPAPIFQRLIYDSFEVEGVPAGGGTALIAPGNMSLEGAAPGQVTLSWTDPNGGKARTVIQRSTDGVSYQEIAAVGAGQTQYIDMNAGLAGQVSYRLLARGTLGDSGAGAPDMVDLDMLTQNLGGGDSGSMTGTLSPPGSGSASGCFIATAAYGSYLEPHVKVLRSFRDHYLLGNVPGLLLVKAYYAFSPPLARIIAPSPLLRACVRRELLPVVLLLQYPWLALLLFLVLLSVACSLTRRREAGARTEAARRQ